MTPLKILRYEWLLSLTGMHNADKICSLALNKHADNEGYCWPSIKSMGKECGLSMRQISRSIRNLKRIGFIEIFKLEKGPRSGNFYWLQFPEELVRPNDPDRELPAFRRVKDAKKPGRNAGGEDDMVSHANGHSVPFGDARMSSPDGQDVMSGVDRVSSWGMTGCPTELIDPESLDPEGVKGNGVRAEGQQGNTRHVTPAATPLDERKGPGLQEAGKSAPTLFQKTDGENRELADAVLALFCRICPTLPRIDHLTRRRARRIARISSRVGDGNSLGWWQDYFLKVKLSDFLTGGGKKGWRATFDWLLDPANAAKVLAGNYNNPVSVPENREANILSYVESMAKQVEGDVADDL